MPPKPIWKLPPFASVFADAFVQGTELDGGHVVYSCQAIMYALAALTHDAPPHDAPPQEEGPAEGRDAKDTAKGNTGAAALAAAGAASRPRTSKAALSLFSDADLAHLATIAGLIRGCARIGAAQIKDGESFLKFLKEFIDSLAALEPGQLMLVPGGWDGENSRGTLVHIIERGSDDTFSFVTCNGGCAGIEYHPSTGAVPVPASTENSDDTESAEAKTEDVSASASSSSSPSLPTAGSAPKLKFKTCIRIENIPVSRIADKALWTAMLSQWMKKPEGEYQRAEVIYDVLLPWLAGGRLLPDALAETKNDPRSTWRTPCRSGGSSSYKSLWEAVRYIGLHLGLRPAQLKQLSFCVRTTFLDLVTRDLSVMADPKRQFGEWEIPESLQDTGGPDSNESKGQDGMGSGEGGGSSRDPLVSILESAGPLITSAGSTVANLTAVIGGKPIALYFSGHWCGPCRQFTPLLKEFYTSIKREGKPFELVFVSHDRSQQEFAEYFATMPWHAVPFSPQGRAAARAAP